MSWTRNAAPQQRDLFKKDALVDVAKLAQAIIDAGIIPADIAADNMEDWTNTFADCLQEISDLESDTSGLIAQFAVQECPNCHADNQSVFDYNVAARSVHCQACEHVWHVNEPAPEVTE